MIRARIKTIKTKIDATYIPAPIVSPIADAAQIVAAEVSPFMFSPCRKIAPPPKKPIPETTCAASLAGSAFTDFPRFSESNINKVDERLIRITVLTPIGCCLNFRSSPRANPAIKLNRILKPI